MKGDTRKQADHHGNPGWRGCPFKSIADVDRMGSSAGM